MNRKYFRWESDKVGNMAMVKALTLHGKMMKKCEKSLHSSFLLYCKKVNVVALCALCCLREELACRLPEMEQPGSDQENLDSEASLSSESLLDDRVATASLTTGSTTETEGQY